MRVTVGTYARTTKVTDPNRDELRARVSAAHVARLGTVDPTGRPHLVPICFALADDVVYTAVDQKPKRTKRLARLENIRAHPEVAILVDHYDEDWSRLWWVRLRGEARVIEGGSELARAISLLTAKYDQYRREPPTGPAVAVDVREWRGWSAAAAAGTEGGSG
jgi:PPOX class probable F420-dependent enzyme